MTEEKIPSSKEGGNPASPSDTILMRLPTELFTALVSHLHVRDIKNLRLASKTICERAKLRLDRVFISASPRDIEVFRAVADHETFRKGIKEIIWDDALLRGEDVVPDADDYAALYETPPPEGCPRWFMRACRESLEDFAHRRGTENGARTRRSEWVDGELVSLEEEPPEWVTRSKQMEEQLPLNVCWDTYHQLLMQQRDILSSGADVEALRLGLNRFSSLERITITPATHGFLFRPMYQTPSIRSLPYGFVYPIPRGWPTVEIGYEPFDSMPWNDEVDKMQWRGFCIVAQELANFPDHQISELVLDVHHLNTGLNCRIFEESNEEYENLVTILRRPGFSRIDLALQTDVEELGDWPSFRSGLLKDALSQARDIRHFSLRTQLDEDACYEAIQPGTDESVEIFIPLRALFPIEQWQKLQHFGLSNFPVRQDDLLALLAAMPSTLRSIELSFLIFLGDGGDYGDLLIDRLA